MAWLSLIEGVVVAAAAIASTWILWLTFRSVNAQTELSRRQFTLATSDRFVPQLSVDLGKWAQPRTMDGGEGSISVLVRNLGITSIKIRNAELLFGDIRHSSARRRDGKRGSWRHSEDVPANWGLQRRTWIPRRRVDSRI